MDDYTDCSRDECYWRLQFNLTSWSLFFLEKDSWPYQDIIYLWWVLHRIYIYFFMLYLFFIISYFIFKLMMLIKSGILLKNLLVLTYPKILHNSFIPTIYENFESVFLLTLGKRKFGNLHPCLNWAIERIKEVLRYFYRITF